MRPPTTGIGRIKLERHQQFDRVVASWRKSKIARHYPHNGRRLRVDLYLLADDVVFATECALPQAIRDQRYIWSTVAILFRREVATLCRLHPECVNQSASDSSGSNAQRFTICAHILSTRGPAANRLP